jgi:hypothetical protein
MFAWLGRALAPQAVLRSIAMHTQEIATIRQQLADIRAWLAETEHKLDRMTLAPKAAPLSTDEIIAAASSATAVYKSLEQELGVDRRTILARVERLVKAHNLAERFPEWGTDLKLAKYLAERVDGDRRRITVALEALS